MINTLEKRRQQLEDYNSNYYCGSSCLLSLYFVIEAISNASTEFDEMFPNIESLILSLFDEDTRLFDLSKKKDEMSEQDWREAISILRDYHDLIISLNLLEKFCKDIGKERYLVFIASDKKFLIDIVNSTIDGFSQFNEKPEEFASFIYM